MSDQRTVLVVEDDEAVRQAATRALEHGGYRVLAAADGEAAWTTLSSRVAEIDLVLVDVVLPRIGGRAFVTLAATLPNPPKLLVTSGVDIDWQQGMPQSLGDIGFVAKPWTVKELLQAVRKALGEG